MKKLFLVLSLILMFVATSLAIGLDDEDMALFVDGESNTQYYPTWEEIKDKILEHLEDIGQLTNTDEQAITEFAVLGDKLYITLEGDESGQHEVDLSSVFGSGGLRQLTDVTVGETGMFLRQDSDGGFSFRVIEGDELEAILDDYYDGTAWRDELTSDELAAIRAASTPTNLNPLATINDLFSGSYDDLDDKPTTITAQQSSDIETNNAKVSYPGPELTSDELAALQGAASPSVTNPFATIDDLDGLTGEGGDDNQTLSFTSPNLSIVGGNTVDLSGIQDGYEANTDEQDLGLAGSTLSITGGNSVVLPFSTVSSLGLDQVDNTSDVDKPVSTAQQTALDLKTDKSSITAFGLTLLDDTTATEARSTLQLGTAATTASSAYATWQQGQLATTSVQPSDLATVATSGEYASLIGKPTIPTNNNQLTNGMGYINNITGNEGVFDGWDKDVSDNFSGVYSDLSGKPSLNFQPLDDDLTDLADGSLSGGKVGTGIDADNITTGTLAEERLPSEAATDTELASSISSLESATATDIASLGDSIAADMAEHTGAADPHAGYMLESNIGTGIGNYMVFVDAGTCSDTSYTDETTCESNSETWTPAAGVPFKLNVADSGDVDAAGISNGQGLFWNATTEKFEPGDGGGDDLGDATASMVSALFSGTGDYLKSDGTKGTPSGGTLTITEQSSDPSYSEMSTGDLVISTSSGDLFYKSATGGYTFAGTYIVDPTYSLTMAITDTTGTGSTFTVDSIAADVGDTPKTWTGLSSATQAVTFAASSTETSSCTGTGVTGSDPNWVVDMSSANVTDMACTVSAASATPVLTEIDNIPRGSTSPGSVGLNAVGGIGGVFTLSSTHNGKHFYSIKIAVTSVDATGYYTCRVDDDNDLGSEYIATSDSESVSTDGTYEIVWDDSTTSISDATTYYWACMESDDAMDSLLAYSNDVDNHAYDYGSGDWVLDHTDDPARDLEVEIYVK